MDCEEHRARRIPSDTVGSNGLVYCFCIRTALSAPSMPLGETFRSVQLESRPLLTASLSASHDGWPTEQTRASQAIVAIGSRSRSKGWFGTVRAEACYDLI